MKSSLAVPCIIRIANSKFHIHPNALRIYYVSLILVWGVNRNSTKQTDISISEIQCFIQMCALFFLHSASAWIHTHTENEIHTEYRPCMMQRQTNSKINFPIRQIYPTLDKCCLYIWTFECFLQLRMDSAPFFSGALAFTYIQKDSKEAKKSYVCSAAQYNNSKNNSVFLLKKCFALALKWKFTHSLPHPKKQKKLFLSRFALRNLCLSEYVDSSLNNNNRRPKWRNSVNKRKKIDKFEKCKIQLKWNGRIDWLWIRVIFE